MKLVFLLAGICLAAPDLQEASRENAKTKTLGRSLYLYDMASAFASDIMAESWKNYGKFDLNGYLTIRDGKNWKVIYTGESGAKVKKYYQVVLRKDSGKPDTAFEISPPADLDSAEAVMYKAKRKANDAPIKEFCSPNYNKILIPNGNQWSVYFISATTKPGLVVVGGHYRIDIDSTGDKIINVEQFTNSCLEIPGAEADNGKSRVFLTHLRSKYPNEMHYYSTLLHSLDMYIMVDKDVWFLTEDVIIYMGDRDKIRKP